jgi:parallel beta-helix repeat protein
VEVRSSAALVLVIAAAGLLFASVGSTAREGLVLYVAPDGNDAWSGRAESPRAGGADGPLATITRARDAIRALPPEVRRRAPVTVLLRGGRYELAETLVFGPEDSGTAEAPITYAAYPGEQPVLSGGRRLTGWSHTRGPKWWVQLPEVLAGEWRFRQLFVNGRRAQRARRPDVGFFRAEGPISSGPLASLQYRRGDIDPAWQMRREVEVVALQEWAELRMPIVEVETRSRRVMLAGPWAGAAHEHRPRYWIENAPEALDLPGEWFLDTQTGRLTYWPLQGEDMLRAETVAPALTQLVRIAGDAAGGKPVAFLRFHGLGFEHADWTLAAEGYADMQSAYDVPAALDVVGAHDIVIENCRLQHLGGYGIALGQRCRTNRVLGNDISDVGAGGVKIGEPVMCQAAAEQTGENVISDNDIHHIGRVYPGAAGIWVGQSGGNTIRSNHVYSTYYTGIAVGWTWGYGETSARENVIEQNHVHHIGQGMLSGVAGIATLGVQPGTVIRGNVIHDVDAYDYGGWGISLGEGSSNILVENNVVYHTKSGGFHQYSGRENVVRNNVFAFSRGGQIARTKAEAHLGFTFEHNIVYWQDGSLLDGNWSGDGFRLDRNLYFQAAGKPVAFGSASPEDWHARGQDVHSRIADPRFIAPSRGDFRLKQGSPALGLGFRPITVNVPSPVAPGR